MPDAHYIDIPLQITATPLMCFSTDIIKVDTTQGIASPILWSVGASNNNSIRYIGDCAAFGWFGFFKQQLWGRLTVNNGEVIKPITKQINCTTLLAFATDAVATDAAATDASAFACLYNKSTDTTEYFSSYIADIGAFTYVIIAIQTLGKGSNG